MVHDSEDPDNSHFDVVDQTVWEPGQGLSPQTTPDDGRGLRVGQDLLSGVKDSREERMTKTGATCFIELCGIQELGLRKGVEGVARHEISAATRRNTSSPGCASTWPL